MKHVCLQSTRWLKLLKEKLVQALLETLVSSGEIEILEIDVVALKSDATMYVSCIATKERRERVLKCRILG